MQVITGVMNKDGQIVSKVTHQPIKGSSRVLDSSSGSCNLTPDLASTSAGGGGDMNLTSLEQSSNELETLTNAVDSVLSQLVLSSYGGSFESDLQRRQSFENSTPNLIYSSPGALSSRISSDPYYEPWVVTGSHGDADSREPVVGTEFVDSIVREKLEPLLHDFINNNSVSSSFTSSSNYDDQSTKYPNSRFNGGPGIVFKTKSNEVSSAGAFPGVVNTGVRIVDSEVSVSGTTASFAAIQNCNLNGAVFSAANAANVTGNGLKVVSSKKQSQSSFWANNQLQLETPVGSMEEQKNFLCRKIVDCVNKLQHWAENCPYRQVRESLSAFLRSLSESQGFPIDVSNLIRPHSKSEYIPKLDIDCHNGLSKAEESFRENCIKRIHSSNVSPSSSLERSSPSPRTVSECIPSDSSSPSNTGPSTPSRTPSRLRRATDDAQLYNSGNNTDNEDKNESEDTRHVLAKSASLKSQNSVSSASCKLVDKYKLYVWAFKLHQLRIPNVMYLMSYHPKYMAAHLSFVESLQLDTTFNKTLIAYLGIMGAARFDCSVLIDYLVDGLPEDDLFVQRGFDQEIAAESPVDSQIPPKRKAMQLDVKALVELNALLAHAPWKITGQHVKAVVEGSDRSMQWPQTQLVQAIIILAHYHALSGFILSCGVLHDSYLRRSSEQIVPLIRAPSSCDVSTTSPARTPKSSSAGSHDSGSAYDALQNSASTKRPLIGMDVDSSQLSDGALSARKISSSSNMMGKQFSFSPPPDSSCEEAATTYGAQSVNNYHGTGNNNVVGGGGGNSLTVHSVENSSPSANSGGVTPVSGRATPSHFFPLCDEEGAEFIKQLQSMPHRLDSGEFHLSDLDLSKYFSSDQASSMDGVSIVQPVTTEAPAIVASAVSGSFGSTDSESFSGSSSAYSNSKSSLSNFAKSASVSPRNAKYLGVQMGHEDFVGQHIETNEDSLNCVINEMDNLLPNNSSLKEKVEKRIKTAFEMTYNCFGKPGKFGAEGDFDTTSFRRTIPCTCLMTHGIVYDDFNYHLIDFFSSKQGHLFIDFAKRALVEPQTITRKFFQHSNPYGLDFSEMVHICILVMEVRMQIELYYAMKAIIEYRESE